MKARKAVLVTNEDQAFTLLKPLSEEFQNQLLVIFEDAYGSVRTDVLKYGNILHDLNIDNNRLRFILLELEVSEEVLLWYDEHVGLLF